MQGHSGEHLVSGLIHAKYGYDNVGFHMGTEEITIDLNGLLEWEDLMEIEKKANRIIWEDREIYAGFPSAEELAHMDTGAKKNSPVLFVSSAFLAVIPVPAAVPNGGFSYVLGSQSEDMRALSKELNGELSGRGGGSSQMAQGTFFARKEELLSSLAARGFVMAD